MNAVTLPPDLERDDVKLEGERDGSAEIEESAAEPHDIIAEAERGLT